MTLWEVYKSRQSSRRFKVFFFCPLKSSQWAFVPVKKTQLRPWHWNEKLQKKMPRDASHDLAKFKNYFKVNISMTCKWQTQTFIIRLQSCLKHHLIAFVGESNMNKTTSKCDRLSLHQVSILLKLMGKGSTISDSLKETRQSDNSRVKWLISNMLNILLFVQDVSAMQSSINTGLDSTRTNREEKKDTSGSFPPVYLQSICFSWNTGRLSSEILAGGGKVGRWLSPSIPFLEKKI